MCIPILLLRNGSVLGRPCGRFTGSFLTKVLIAPPSLLLAQSTVTCCSLPQQHLVTCHEMYTVHPSEMQILYFVMKDLCSDMTRQTQHRFMPAKTGVTQFFPYNDVFSSIHLFHVQPPLLLFTKRHELQLRLPVSTSARG
jgi:hypothetical protein